MPPAPPSPSSPLRPKSISSALAAVADEPQHQLVSHAQRGLARATATAADASVAVRHEARRPAFELPDNVSRRPAAGVAGPTAVATGPPGKGAAGRRGAPQAAAWGPPKRLWGVTPPPAGDRGGVGPWKRARLSGVPTGPERAAARRKRQHFAKTAVARRLALWRSRVVDGERQVVYVTLSGEVLPKSGRSFRAATADQRYLKARGVGSSRPQGSSLRPEGLEPYAGRRGSDPRALAHWCVPESVEAAYRDVGVRRLYAWQASCIGAPGVLEGRSLVYVAPTSAGKSLVAEVLVLRKLLFQGRRALLVLPYVSICVERVEQLRRLWGACGVRVEGLHSASDGSWHAGVDVAVCTIEKASALLNRLLEEDALLRDVGTIVVDEMHLLGDDHRGYLLELILVKARLSAMSAVGGRGSSEALQIIGLSATLPNVRVLAEWLGAHLHVSDDRPVPLTLGIAHRGRVLAPDEDSASSAAASQPPARPRDPDGLVPLVWECAAASQSVLVFCATKDWCEKAALLLAEELPALQEPADGASRGPKAEARWRVVEELRQTPAGLCPVLARTLPQGVAYHHAGLTVEERAVLEGAYRAGIVGCLCATSTLAAGVNLPARRVIIRSMKIGSEPMDPTRFRQMAGRAGRAGLDHRGECVVMARSGRDLGDARALLAAELGHLRSSLRGERLGQLVLEAVSLGLVRSVAALEGAFARSLLRFHEERAAPEGPAALLGDVHAALAHLEALHVVRVDPGAPEPRAAAADEGASQRGGASGGGSTETCASSALDGAGQAEAAEAATGSMRYPKTASVLATPLGDGVVYSALKPAEALRIFADLQRARTGVRLDTDLHIIFLATPVSASTEPAWDRFLTLYERLPARDRAVADAVGVNHQFLVQQSLGRHGPPRGWQGIGDWRSERGRLEALHRRFWAALALRDLAAELSPARVAATYAVPRGALQSLQGLAATYCRMVQQLCQRLRWHEMAALFESIMPRLNFGISAEVAPLCQIPGVHAGRARALWDAGFTSIEDVARARATAVEAALRRHCQFESHCTDDAAARCQEAVVREAAQRIVRGAQDRLGAQLQELEDEAEDEQLRLRQTAVLAAGPGPAAAAPGP